MRFFSDCFLASLPNCLAWLIRIIYAPILSYNIINAELTFNIQPIKTVWEALDIMLVNNDQKFNRFGAGLYEDEESAVDPRKTKRVRVI